MHRTVVNVEGKKTYFVFPRGKQAQQRLCKQNIFLKAHFFNISEPLKMLLYL